MALPWWQDYKNVGITIIIRLHTLKACLETHHQMGAKNTDTLSVVGWCNNSWGKRFAAETYKLDSRPSYAYMITVNPLTVMHRIYQALRCNYTARATCQKYPALHQQDAFDACH